MIAAGGTIVAERSGSIEGKPTTAAEPAPLPSSAPAPPPPVPMATTTSTADGALQDDFATLKSQTAGDIGIVALPIGAGAPVVLGDWSTGAAWSTSKVPLSIAALRADPSLTGSATSAITASDNSAADALWTSLGPPTDAAVKVEAVLREAGDPTAVQSQRVAGAQFSAFGQTQWSLENQARFMAWMACRTDEPAIGPVWDLMGQITADQRWGLGNVPTTRFKGGWGPSSAGYLVRQLGVIDQGGQMTAIAIASDSGSFGSGTNDLSAIATFLDQHLAALPKGACPAG